MYVTYLSDRIAILIYIYKYMCVYIYIYIYLNLVFSSSWLTSRHACLMDLFCCYVVNIILLRSLWRETQNLTCFRYVHLCVILFIIKTSSLMWYIISVWGCCQLQIISPTQTTCFINITHTAHCRNIWLRCSARTFTYIALQWNFYI